MPLYLLSLGRRARPLSCKSIMDPNVSFDATPQRTQDEYIFKYHNPK